MMLFHIPSLKIFEGNNLPKRSPHLSEPGVLRAVIKHPDSNVEQQLLHVPGWFHVSVNDSGLSKCIAPDF